MDSKLNTVNALNEMQFPLGKGVHKLNGHTTEYKINFEACDWNEFDK